MFDRKVTNNLAIAPAPQRITPVGAGVIFSLDVRMGSGPSSVKFN